MISQENVSYRLEESIVSKALALYHFVLEKSLLYATSA